MVYTDSECKTIDSTTSLLKAYSALSYLVLLASLFSGKIVGLELFGVLQLAYFSLAEHSFLNIYLSPLVSFKLFNGLNLQLFSETSYVTVILKDMGVASNFLNNWNIMLVVFYAYLLAAGGCYFFFGLRKRPLLRKYSIIALKQGMTTFVLFNAFNIAFSSGAHFKYATTSDSLYGAGSFLSVLTLMAMVVLVLSLQLSEMSSFGEFKRKFKDCEGQFYVQLTVLYRLALGLYCAAKSDYDYGSLVIQAICILFVLYVIVNLPFRDVWQNYRAVFVHLLTAYILLVANYYRAMKSNTPVSVKARIYGPVVLELVLIGFCIVGSAAVLVRECYGMYQNYVVSKSKIKPKS